MLLRRGGVPRPVIDESLRLRCRISRDVVVGAVVVWWERSTFLAPDAEIWQTIVAAGRQDTDPDDLVCSPDVSLLGASSDHLIVETGTRIDPGTGIRFQPGYSALLRSMTSPYVDKRFRDDHDPRRSTVVATRHRPDKPTSPRSISAPTLRLVPRLPAAGHER